MQIQILSIIIEKDGDNYIGRSPNLLGVSVAGKSRDEVESAIFAEIEKRLNRIYQLHRDRINLSRLPVEESILCVYPIPNVDPNQCPHTATLQGLCWSHWQKVYGHAVSTKKHNEMYPLCGETDQDILNHWESPCPFKAENSNWAEILEEKKREARIKRSKEQREAKIHKRKTDKRCEGILNNGTQCSSLAERGKFCERHWGQKYRKEN